MRKIALLFAVFFLAALIYPANAPAPIVEPYCGDGIVNQPGEDCDIDDAGYGDDSACPGMCVDCTCPPPPKCGDDMVNQEEEECDGTDDDACPGECRSDCTCPPPGMCAPKTQGFWKRICDGFYGEKSLHPETPEGFSSEMLCMDFDGSPRSDPCVRADSQVAALQLNTIYGYLDKNCEIEYDCDDTLATVQDALDAIPTLSCKDAADLAEAINSSKAL